MTIVEETDILPSSRAPERAVRLAEAETLMAFPLPESVPDPVAVKFTTPWPEMLKVHVNAWLAPAFIVNGPAGNGPEIRFTRLAPELTWIAGFIPVAAADP